MASILKTSAPLKVPSISLAPRNFEKNMSNLLQSYKILFGGISRD